MGEATKKLFSAAVITLSDKGAQGKRTDESGPLLCEMLENSGICTVTETIMLADDPVELKKQLIRMSDTEKYALVITTGGTGLSPRDFTPEATLAVADKNIPGIAEYLRYKSFEITPKAMLSRGVSVMRGQTLIVNLPGSPKAARENLEFLLPALRHGLEIMTGEAAECGASDKKQHRKHEVSLLDRQTRNLIDSEKIPEALCQKRFREDITVDDIDTSALKVGDVIEACGIRIEITEAGKRCFEECALYRAEGPCALARHAVFGKKI